MQFWLLQSDGPEHCWPSGSRHVTSHEPLQQLALLVHPVPSGRQGPASGINAPVVAPLPPEEPVELVPPPAVVSPPELSAAPLVPVLAAAPLVPVLAAAELAVDPVVPGPAAIEAPELELACCEPVITDCVQAVNASALAAANNRHAPAALTFGIFASPSLGQHTLAGRDRKARGARRNLSARPRRSATHRGWADELAALRELRIGAS